MTSLSPGAGSGVVAADWRGLEFRIVTSLAPAGADSLVDARETGAAVGAGAGCWAGAAGVAALTVSVGRGLEEALPVVAGADDIELEGVA